MYVCVCVSDYVGVWRGERIDRNKNIVNGVYAKVEIYYK